MERIEVGNVVKGLIVGASILMLCACATKPSVPAVSGADQASRIQKTGPAGGSERVEDSVFKPQQVINPNPGIEKDKLLVSYNMKAVRSESGYLLQLSLIFRNQKDKKVYVRPGITLLDDKGQRIEAYSKAAFLKSVSGIKETSHPTSSPAGAKGGSPGSAQERKNWANSYWLKDRFSLSAQGIEIGELVYHSAGIKVPMTLIVNAVHQKYVFNITDPLPVVGADGWIAEHH